MAEHVSAEEHSDVAFVGAPDSLEARLAAEAGIDFIPVKAKGWDRARPLTLVTASLRAATSFFRCLRILRTWRADVVVGFGGYVSVPLGLAASFAGVPLVLHEQNSVPGLANRVLSRWAACVCVTYPESISRLAHTDRALVTGDPVRPTVLQADAARGRAALGLDGDGPVLLAFGGSRGARHINEALVGLYGRLSAIEGLRVVHVAGRTEKASVQGILAKAAGGGATPWWQVLEYVDAMGDALAAADLVVCRAGATSIAELTVLGKPSVLVPYPFATDDHQSQNALPLLAAKAAVLVSDSGLDSPAFGDEIVSLLTDGERRRAMATAASLLGRPLAAHAVAEAALEAGAAGSPWRFRVKREKPAPDPAPAPVPGVEPVSAPAQSTQSGAAPAPDDTAKAEVRP